MPDQLSSVIEVSPLTGTKKEQLFYDAYGNQDCITTDSYTSSACPAAPSFGGTNNPILRVDYAYDGFQRLDTFRIYTIHTVVNERTQICYTCSIGTELGVDTRQMALQSE